MRPVLLLIGLAALGLALALGLPALLANRERQVRDTNAERYLAWRGRAPRRDGAAPGGGPSPAEQRRLALAAALAAGGLACLVAFLVIS